jgi:hypothetical protein
MGVPSTQSAGRGAACAELLQAARFARSDRVRLYSMLDNNEVVLTINADIAQEAQNALSA